MVHQRAFSYNLKILFCIILFLASYLANAQPDYNLGEDYHDDLCPQLTMIVKWGVRAAFVNDSRIAASLLRLHFHDCFVNGCDGSVLLDDTKDLKGEKNALPNRNSARGYEVIESIKAEVENHCPSIVSCVDILTLAAREAVLMVGGPYWHVTLGRRDGLNASEKAANENLPSPFHPLDVIISKFAANGLDMKDVVVLSGAHTIGYAQCFTFKGRLFNHKGSGKPDPILDSSLLSNLQNTCPNVDGSNNKLVGLDYQSTYRFDNAYYKNLMNNAGLLDSDQALMGNQETAKLVKSYSMSPSLYAREFAASMVKLGNIGVLTGEQGQIRKKCGSIN